MSLQHYRELTRQIETDPEYWKDIAVSDFAREITQIMRRRKIGNSDLARRMGVKRQYVTKLLAGTNATLGSMVKLAMALDAVVRIRLEGKEERALEEKTAAASASAVGETVVVMANYLAGRQKVSTFMDSSDPVAVRGGR